MNLADISQETLEAIKKAQTTGIDAATNIDGVDLSRVVSLYPVVTPFRNQLGRVQAPMGAPVAGWNAILNINNQVTLPNVAFDVAGPIAPIRDQFVSAPYVVLSEGGRVTRDAMTLALNYDDVKARETIYTLNQLMIGEDILAIGGQAFALATPSAPTVAVTASTGGSVTGTLNVKISARAGHNYYGGGGGIASSAGTVDAGTTATNVATATWDAVVGAVAYDVFVSSSTSYVYYTTVTTTSATISSIPTVAQALPSLPLLSSTVPSGPPTADSTANSTMFNGLLGSIIGDYSDAGPLVAHGSGLSSGATLVDGGGVPLTISGQSVTQLDEMLQGLWDNSLLSPDVLMMNTYQRKAITEGLGQSGSSVQYLTPADPSGRSNQAAGGYVTRYISPVTGESIRIESHPHLPPGTIVARSDKVPFPGSGIGNVFEMRTLMDYNQWEYGSSRVAGTVGGGPRYDFEVRCIETFVNKAPSAQAICYNVADGYTSS